jgi:hypothetical protein
MLVEYAKHPYAGSRRLRFVLKRRLHQDSIARVSELRPWPAGIPRKGL